MNVISSKQTLILSGERIPGRGVFFRAGHASTASNSPPIDAYGNPQSPTGTRLSAYLRPEDQYAQTQRLLIDHPEAPHIDVHA